MKKIVLSIASLLLASGMAVAGSDHFGSDFIPAAGSYPTTVSHPMASGAVDLGATKSITDAAAAATSGAGMTAPASGQGIWGH